MKDIKESSIVVSE